MAQEERPFEERFLAKAPAQTNAQDAATRVYNRGGILVRSDPFVAAADRKGRPFAQTKWHDSQGISPPTNSFAGAPQTMMPAALESKDPVERFKNKILQRGGAGGIHSLGRSFRIMDIDHSNTINAEELQIGLEHYGLDMSKKDIDELIQVVGKGRPITYSAFLVTVRGTINKRRQTLIDMAFKVLDKACKGSVTVEDVQDRFNGNHHPDVLAGKLHPSEALGEFLSNFDSADHDGTVTLNDFTEYYRNVSASIDNDDYFELMVRNAWHIPGGEGWCANTSNIRLLVVTADGAQKVVMIKDDLGLDVHNHDAVMNALKKQGITNVVKFSLTENI